MGTSRLLLGNILALGGSLCFAISTQQPTKKKMLKVQCVDASLSALACLVLGGVSGFTTNLVALLRALLIIHDKLNKYFLVVIILAIGGLGIAFNTNGLIGLLPVVASIQFTVVLSTDNKSIMFVKLYLALNICLWLVFSLHIKNYVAVLNYLVSLGLTIFRLVKHVKENNKTVHSGVQ